MLKRIILSSIALFIILSIVFIKEILVSYSSFFVIDNASKGADAIILLAGNSITRAPHVAQLYKDGYAPLVLVTETKGMGTKKYPFIEDDFKYSDMILGFEDVLNRDKIPSIKDGATSTLDEAIDFIYYLKNHKMERVILVTDALHTRRALYAFEKIMKKNGIDIKIEVSAARNSIYDETNWYLKEAGISDHLLEGVKFILYIFISNNVKGIEEA